MSGPEETPQTSAAQGDGATAPETLSAPLATHDLAGGVVHGDAVQVPADVLRVVDALPSGSALSVTVNGLRVDEAGLSWGDAVQIGRYRLVLLERQVEQS